MRIICQGSLLDTEMLDMIKRQHKNIDCPCCSPMLITGENKIYCACEDIVLSESTSCDSWTMNYIYEMSGVDISVTRIIFGDRIHSNNLLKLLNVENTCHLIFDRCHPMEFDSKKKFGHTWPSLSKHMCELLYAKMEESCYLALNEMRKRVRSAQLKNYIVQEVHASRIRIVDYWTNRHPLYLDRIDNQGAEFNHYSHCTRISFGGFAQPAEQVVQCLERVKDVAK